MDPATFRRHGHELVDWIAEYLEHPERYPVLSRVRPGEIASALPRHAPEAGEPFDAIMATVAALEEDEELVVLAPFEPVPLEGVLGAQGYSYEAIELGPDDWQVTFRRQQ